MKHIRLTLMGLLVFSLLMVSGVIVFAQDSDLIDCPPEPRPSASLVTSSMHLAVYRGVCTNFIPWSEGALAKKLNRTEIENGVPITIKPGTNAGFESTQISLNGNGGSDDFWNWMNTGTDSFQYYGYNPRPNGFSCGSNCSIGVAPWP